MNTHSQVAHAPVASPSSIHDAIDQCLRCHRECTETLQYCLQKGGEHVDPHHLKLMQSCVEITYMTARFMMMQSPYYKQLAETCAQVAQACARDCEEMGDDAMLACAKVCLETAKALRV